MVAVTKERLKVIRSNTAEVKMVNGKPQTVTPENIERFLKGELTWAQVQGLSMKQAYGIAEIGYQLFTQGKYGDAETIFKGLVALNPYDGYFHSVLGSIYARGGQDDRAIQEYSVAANLELADPQVYVNRAELLLKKGAFQEALSDLKQAVSSDPSGKSPAVQRARSLAAATVKLLEQMLQSKQQAAPSVKKK